MAYSIKPILLSYQGDQGKQLVIQVIYKRKKVKVPTPYRIHDHEWNGKEVIAGKQKAAKNNYIIEQKNLIEEKLINAIRKSPDFNLGEIVKGKQDVPYFHTFIKTFAEQVAHRVDRTTNYHHLYLAETVEQFKKVFLYEVDQVFLLQLEKHLIDQGDQHNTVQKKMKNYKKILREAMRRGLIKEEQYVNYKVPLYKQKIPEYLDADEMKAFKVACDGLPDELKVCGYYFLLSCFAGYRLGDARNFNYKDRVRGTQIILKAKKNGEIVSMPIYPMLKQVLEYVRVNPLPYSEQYARKVVYDIARTAGVDRKIVYHTSRHSFAMMLVEHDFSIEEIAELMGITVKTARIYARVTNKQLARKVTEKLANIHEENTRKPRGKNKKI